MQQWFNNLARKEQLYLVVAAVFIVGYLYFQLIWSPLKGATQRVQQQNQVSSESLHNMQRMASEYKALQKSGAQANAQSDNLPSLIDTTVASNGLRMDRFQPSARGDVQVRFESASFNKLINWLADVEANGVTVKELSFSASDTPGIVSLSVRLK